MKWKRLLWKLRPQDGGWAYEAVYRCGRARVKVDIFVHYNKVEASHLRVKVLDPESLKWNVIVNNPLTAEYALWQARQHSAPEHRWFAEDAEKLMQEAAIILEGIVDVENGNG